jgi:hypothetical protein
LNGNTYTGTFSNGLKHGKGKWKKKGTDMNKCNNYDGDYELDKKNGWGVFEWESGNCYRGEYVDDERHGYGEMHWIDESQYKGKWVHGV